MEIIRSIKDLILLGEFRDLSTSLNKLFKVNQNFNDSDKIQEKMECNLI